MARHARRGDTLLARRAGRWRRGRDRAFRPRAASAPSYSFRRRRGSPRRSSAVKTMPGKRLLMYRDDDGKARADPDRGPEQRYLREIAGVEITAKDFRTLHASAWPARRWPSSSRRSRRTGAQAADGGGDQAGCGRSCRTRRPSAGQSYIAPCLFKLFEKGRLAAIWAAGGRRCDGVQAARSAAGGGAGRLGSARRRLRQAAVVDVGAASRERPQRTCRSMSATVSGVGEQEALEGVAAHARRACGTAPRSRRLRP